MIIKQLLRGNIYWQKLEINLSELPHNFPNKSTEPRIVYTRASFHRICTQHIRAVETILRKYVLTLTFNSHTWLQQV